MVNEFLKNSYCKPKAGCCPEVLFTTYSSVTQDHCSGGNKFTTQLKFSLMTALSVKPHISLYLGNFDSHKYFKLKNEPRKLTFSFISHLYSVGKWL